MDSALSQDSVDALRQQFSGEVVGPKDSGYDEMRAVHNGLIDKRPALIARCVNAADIADAVRFARTEGLEISARGGGHNVAGKAVIDGGMMIDLANMRGSYVDPAKRRPRIQGGATWNDYNRATQQHGLATTGGVVSTTGVAGLTLGGGFGWLMGRFGMAVDNLRSVELVTADGEVLQVSSETDPDLLWGLRGGGGRCGCLRRTRTSPPTILTSSHVSSCSFTRPTALATRSSRCRYATAATSEPARHYSLRYARSEHQRST